VAVHLFTVGHETPVAGTPPNEIEVPPADVLKFEPLMVTMLPPFTEPAFGLIEEMTGAGATAGTRQMWP